MARNTLNVRLLKADIANPSDALKEDHGLEQIGAVTDTSAFYAGMAYQNPPRWRTFFPPNTQGQLNHLFGAAPAGVLFRRVQNEDGTVARWFAVCFGSAYFSFDIDQFEPHFGIRVALNRTAQQSLRSVDFRRPEEGTLVTRTQSSKPTAIFGFGMDAYNSILHAISTRAEEGDFGTTISGSDALKLTTDVSFENLDAKLQEILQAYLEELPEGIADWYGNILPVRDGPLKDQLDNLLVASIAAGDTDGIHLAPPEIFEHGSLEEIKFSGQGHSPPFESLSLTNYRSVRDNITLEQIKSDKVRIRSDNGDRYFDRWTVYRSLSAEIDHENQRYVLSAGQWYRIAGDYVERINQEVADIPDLDWELPGYEFGTSEGAYNEAAANLDDGLFLYDKDLVQFHGERGRIEFCDLLTSNAHIIHVKKRTSSSTLSHVFQQAFASAEAFIDYPELRTQMRNSHPEVHELIPVDRPDTSQYKVTIALMDEGKQYLPFLSKVGLAGLARTLRRMGYQVRFAWIVATNPTEED